MSILQVVVRHQLPTMKTRNSRLTTSLTLYYSHCHHAKAGNKQPQLAFPLIHQTSTDLHNLKTATTMSSSLSKETFWQVVTWSSFSQLVKTYPKSLQLLAFHKPFNSSAINRTHVSIFPKICITSTTFKVFIKFERKIILQCSWYHKDSLKPRWTRCLEGNRCMFWMGFHKEPLTMHYVWQNFRNVDILILHSSFLCIISSLLEDSFFIKVLEVANIGPMLYFCFCSQIFIVLPWCWPSEVIIGKSA